MPFRMIRADITTLKCDAIVNAANSALKAGGGVCGAIFQRAGMEKLQAACQAIGHCDTGHAVVTPGFDLPAKYVIHAVGPVWHGGCQGEEALLRSCYTSALQLAAQMELSSIAFPLISAGIYGYPRGEALTVAVSAISDFLTDERSPDIDVTLTLYETVAYREGVRLFGEIASFLDEHDAAFQRRMKEASARRIDAPDMSAPFNAPFPTSPAPRPAASAPAPRHTNNIAQWIQERFVREETFAQCLLRLIDASGESDAAIYKRANVDRRLFSKIRSNPAYQPSKSTVFAFCLALHLSMDDAELLLRKAGYAFTATSRLDLAISFCLRRGIYDVHRVNAELFELDLPLLGA